MFRESKSTQITCTKYGVTVVSLYLKHHSARIHGICAPHMTGNDEEGGVPTTYVVSFPRVLKTAKCLVPECL